MRKTRGLLLRIPENELDTEVEVGNVAVQGVHGGVGVLGQGAFTLICNVFCVFTQLCEPL